MFRAADRIDEVFKPALHVAVGIEVVDDPVAHLPQRLVEIEPAELIVQMIVQRLRSIDHVGHRVVLPVAGFIDASGRGASSLLEMVGPFRIHLQQTLEIGFVVFRFVDDELALLGRRSVGVLSFGFFFGQVGVLLDKFECFVFLHLLLDAFLQGHDRQLQDFHRLDHARRQHLLLNEPQFLSEGESHGHGSGLV